MSIYDEVAAERARAHALHGDRSIEAWPADDPARLPILVEEVGEVAKEHNEAALEDRAIDLTKLRAELIQVAAVAVAWADRISDDQAAPVDDMARRLAEKMGDPRKAAHPLGLTPDEADQQVVDRAIRTSGLERVLYERPFDEWNRRHPVQPTGPTYDYTDWYVETFGVRPTYGDLGHFADVMNLPVDEFLDRLEQGRLSITDPAVRYRTRGPDVTPG